MLKTPSTGDMSNTTVNERRARIMSENNCLSFELTATTNQKATFASPGPKSLLLSLSLYHVNIYSTIKLYRTDAKLFIFETVLAIHFSLCPFTILAYFPSINIYL